MMGQPPPSTTNNTKRERKALVIVDPSTGNPVKLNSEAPSFVPVNHSANETPNAVTGSKQVLHFSIVHFYILTKFQILKF